MTETPVTKIIFVGILLYEIQEVSEAYVKNDRNQLNLHFPIKIFIQIYGKFYDVQKKILIHNYYVYSVPLKVVGNEKVGGSGMCQTVPIRLRPRRSMFFSLSILLLS
jgi:hypothetical protein